MISDGASLFSARSFSIAQRDTVKFFIEKSGAIALPELNYSTPEASEESSEQGALAVKQDANRVLKLK